jgi:hypothetical protein
MPNGTVATEAAQIPARAAVAVPARRHLECHIDLILDSLNETLPIVAHRLEEACSAASASGADETDAVQCARLGQKRDPGGCPVTRLVRARYPQDAGDRAAPRADRLVRGWLVTRLRNSNASFVLDGEAIRGLDTDRDHDQRRYRRHRRCLGGLLGRARSKQEYEGVSSYETG